MAEIGRGSRGNLREISSLQNDALLAAIIKNPAEDTPRLAYADWLDENGDSPRARFIRLQYEIEKLPPTGAKASKAKKEEEALLKKHEKEWTGKIAGLVDYFRFRRGFVELISASAANFLKHGERLFELAPIREVRFDPVFDQMQALAASPLLGRLEAIGFSSDVSDQIHFDGRLQELLDSPHLATVRRIDFRASSLDTNDLKQIARCPHLGSVVHLDLGYNPFSAAGLRAVARSKCLPALTSLVLCSGAGAGPDAVREVIDSPLADRLEHLVLMWQDLGDEGVKIVTNAKWLTRLRTLDLSENDITDAGAKGLAVAKNLAGLERLTLRGHRETIGKDARDLLKKRFGKDACVF